MQMVTAGHIGASDMVWTEGMSTWQRAETQSWFVSTPPGAMPQTGYQSTNQYANYRPPQPDSLLVWAILMLVCCGIPGIIGGVIGIVQDSNCKSAYARGDYDAALAAYNTGKKWMIGCLIATFVLLFAYLIFAVMLGTFSSFTH